jgi:membrane protease YdiL (CAAX protease family)
MTSKMPTAARTILVVFLQGALLLLALALAFVPFSHAPAALGIPGGYATYLLYPLLLYLLLALSHRWLTRMPLAPLGFSWPGLPSRLALGFALGAATALAVVALTALCHPQVSLALAGPAASPDAVLILLADVWETGFMEEFLVRGYVLPALLRRKIGPHAAVLWSVLFFTLAHFMIRPWWALLPIAVTGLLLGYLYYATASIWTPVGCHLAMNLVFGLLRNEILLRAPGLGDNTAPLAAIQCLVYLLLAALLVAWHRRRVRTGATDFPVPRLWGNARRDDAAPPIE